MRNININILIPATAFLLSLSVWAQNSNDVKNEDFDILIKGAYVFDGSGKDSVRYDVGVRGDRIAYVGKSSEALKAKTVINGKGRYLAPGFIDPHTHYKRQLNHKDKKERALLRALMQGVTTVFEGNDGSSPWPVGKTLDEWGETGIGPNAALFVGHNTIRRKVLGYRDVQPSGEEMEIMKGMVDRGMKEGAFGLSTGLFYTPGFYSTTEEVIALAKVAAAHGGIYDTHQRDEGSQNIGVVNSVKEVLEIAEKAGIHAHISHIKVAGPKAWGKSVELVRMIDEARAGGLEVTANLYPYIASNTGLSSALIPAWARDGGVKAMRPRFGRQELRDSILKGIQASIQARTADPGKFMLSSREAQYNGKTLEQIAREWNMTPEEAVIEICKESSPSVFSFMMIEEDVERFMQQPWVMIGSDGGTGHPRGFGSFARVLEEYVGNRKVISMSRAIHKSSYLTAQTMGIKKRGLIKEGYYADIVLFDPKNIKANSTFEDGLQLASGMDCVLVNGQVVIRRGKWEGILSGQALKYN
ncbi:N-acyl-D-amino-acid deacylase family protein [Sinomicrobium soli]|uniref:N-acyl-D-amino-acid deacylase family protein n=1 Tax=Sinomicrobium sp. N-1-3-6 TaxID=2219864 RepID=UPI000DCBD646|nr:D-aminoacylase [Sinomicrobium sp. N-1-3-6]RAV29657.1 D-aminoacylase [Sinomicrobium sp. N-1-3-6]